MIGSKTPVQVLHQMDRLNMSEMEAHWVLGRLAAAVPNTVAEALDALEALRRAAA